MNIISTGGVWRVFGDDVTVFDALPAETFAVRFNKMTGNYLERYNLRSGSGEKVYGRRMEKADKIMKTFSALGRNMGVILSGDKGIGKSLFARIVSDKAKEAGLPTLVVQENVPGLTAFLESIEQEAVVLFDEFEKNFRSDEDDDGPSAQQSLLSLFDGTAGGKKLFIVTCNDWRDLDSYLVNRPGRFHYHIRFGKPDAEEIREYLTDQVAAEYADQIEPAVSFARRTGLNYDCLRAIVSELNMGYPLADAVEDLNIISTEKSPCSLRLILKDGSIMNGGTVMIQPVSGGTVSRWFSFSSAASDDDWDYDGDDLSVRVTFKTSTIRIDEDSDCLYILPEDFADVRYDDGGLHKSDCDRVRRTGIDRLVLKSEYEDVHYHIPK